MRTQGQNDGERPKTERTDARMDDSFQPKRNLPVCREHRVATIAV